MIEEITGLLICLPPRPKITSYLFWSGGMHQILKSRRWSQEDVPHARGLGRSGRFQPFSPRWRKAISEDPAHISDPENLKKGFFPPFTLDFFSQPSFALLQAQGGMGYWPQIQRWPQTLQHVPGVRGVEDLLGDVRTEKTAPCTSGTEWAWKAFLQQRSPEEARPWETPGTSLSPLNPFGDQSQRFATSPNPAGAL